MREPGSRRRVFVVGTNTGIGKTALVCALLGWGRTLGVRLLPFKPVQSGGEPGERDADRLCRAAALPPETADRICPLSFDEPLAPGLADDKDPFFRPPAANADPVPPALTDCAAALAKLEHDFDPQLTLIEGAGGLHVPMPGGTWLTTWIRELATDVVIAASAGLGTINHTLLTSDALRNEGLPPVGFFLSQTEPSSADPSIDDNPQVIATARGVPYLGTLGPTGVPDGPGPHDLLTPLLSHLEPLP